MTTYAAVKNGFVREVFTPLPEWSHIPIEQLFTPDVADEWVPIDGLDPPPACHWRYRDGAFTPPTQDDFAEIARMNGLR
jgi:hypothetical protein